MFQTLTVPNGVSARFPTARSPRPMTFNGRKRHKITIVATAGTAERVDARKRRSNLYQILRVNETASPVEIKTAYRTLAKRFHPDTGSDGQDFIEIHNAYSTLSDPTARAQYDLSIGSGRRFRLSTENVSGFRFQTKRWETDQCW